MWDRYQRITKEIFWRRIKSTGYIDLPGSKYYVAEGQFEANIIVFNAVINSAQSIGSYIKIELYNKCRPRRVKAANKSEIENILCMKGVMNVTPLFQI